jgi:hypothetical protein
MRSALLLALAFSLCTSCAKKENDEAKIKKLLDTGVAALEARDSKGAAALLADDYRDAKGRTKDKLKGLTFFVLQQGPILVKLGDVGVTVQGDNAVATLRALAVQGSGQLKTAADLLPTNARAFDLTVKLVRDGSGWLVTAVDGDGSSGFD